MVHFKIRNAKSPCWLILRLIMRMQGIHICILVVLHKMSFGGMFCFVFCFCFLFVCLFVCFFFFTGQKTKHFRGDLCYNIEWHQSNLFKYTWMMVLWPKRTPNKQTNKQTNKQNKTKTKKQTNKTKNKNKTSKDNKNKTKTKKKKRKNFFWPPLTWCVFTVW